MSVIGFHRVIEPPGSLPQPALRLDNSRIRFPDEIHINVERLNVDATSWRQILEDVGHSKNEVAARILDIISTRGKLHNPITGSGGLLSGTVAWVGPHIGPGSPKLGSRVASLVSLSLTPLAIDAIIDLNLDTCQVVVQGFAVLFASSPWAELPTDFNPELAISIFDVCGAPKLVSERVKPGSKVFILGAGKSGLLAAAAARQRGAAEVILVDRDKTKLLAAEAALPGITSIHHDVTDTAGMLTFIQEADFTVSCITCAGAEPTAVACTRADGEVVFFSMATDFTRAALFAEGIGSGVTMLIGNGFRPGHAEYALGLVRGNPLLRQALEAH
jgi:L-erythro-3,5-diaminohexanoate dehydrogenase